MSRAERRRQMREQGYHRSADKRGRRASVRAVVQPRFPLASTLIVARPRLVIPTPEETLELQRGRR